VLFRAEIEPSAASVVVAVDDALDFDVSAALQEAEADERQALPRGEHRGRDGVVVFGDVGRDQLQFVDVVLDEVLDLQPGALVGRE
jgi:hypothetical protein